MSLRKRLRFFAILFAVGTLGIFVVVFRPQADEVSASPTPTTVSESELQMYIKVYSAMQENHDLTLDRALVPYKMSVEDFRALERRIQSQPHLVDRVRQALLKLAEAHSVFGESFPTPTPTKTPAKHRPHKRRRK